MPRPLKVYLLSSGEKMNTNHNIAWQRFSVWLLKRNALGTLFVWSYLTTGLVFLVVYAMFKLDVGENWCTLTGVALMWLSVLFMVFAYVPRWENYHKTIESMPSIHGEES